MEFLRSAFELLGISKRQADPASLRIRLKQDKLSDPDNWHGYRQFVSATPREGEQLEHDKLSDFYPPPSLQSWKDKADRNVQSSDRSWSKKIYYTAFRYARDMEGSQVSSFDQRR